MPVKPGKHTKATAQRLYNQRGYISKLLKAGQLDMARSYAAKVGLVLAPVAPGGEGVRPSPRSENVHASAPVTETLPKRNPDPDPATDPAPDRGPHPVLVQHPAPDEFPGTFGTDSVPLLRLSRHSVEKRKFAVMWQAFATRLKRAGAWSVMNWEEFELMQGELGFEMAVEQIVAEVTDKGVVSREPEIGHDDPVGTVQANIVKCPPNRSMRLVRRHDAGEELVCWVPLSSGLKAGNLISMCPNEDERGGWLLVGTYGRHGGRMR